MAEAPTQQMPVWEQRFRAPSVSFPHWARHAPERLVVSSNASGAWQVYAWDRLTGTRRQVTEDPIGVPGGAVTPDGERVVWFADATGDEIGRWMAQPFAGGEAAPLVEGIPDAWSAGLSIRGRGPEQVVAMGTAATEGGYSVWVAHGSDSPRLLHRHEMPVSVAGLSADGTLLALEHAEHGDSIHLALRVVDARTGATVGELYDGEGKGLSVAGWSPVPGDNRLVVDHELTGLDRPALWDPVTGSRHDLAVDLPGEVGLADWWPDASALLVVHSHHGRDELWKLALDPRDPSHPRPVRLEHDPGTVGGAGVRPDGTIWLRHASGARPPTTRVLGTEEVVIAAVDGDRPAMAAPPGFEFRSWWFTNSEGERIHGFVAEPAGAGPHPVVMLVHGGPTWAYHDTYLADVAAWVDHGFAVGMVNYRGSTGYGVEFRDRLIGDPGFPEVADVVAGLDDLVAAGVADSSRAVVAGGSWGGYITLLALGLHPDRWAAGVAAVPVADYVTAFADEAPSLQAFDRTLFGGDPATAGELYRERSPLTYADAVIAPVLILAGDNDSRCPIDQVLNYVEALQERGASVELYRFDAGHGSMVIEERVRQMATEIDFVLERLGVRTRSS